MSAEGTWKPVGGVEFTHLEDGLPRTRTAVTGARNGLPGTGAEFVPYVWNPGERAKRAECEARLAAIRARIGVDKHPETAVCSQCGKVYWLSDGHSCG